MIKVTIPNLPIETVSYNSKKDGSPQQLRLQVAYAHTVDQDGAPTLYPEKFNFPLNRDQQPFPSGDYTYHPSAFQVRNGRLTHSDNRLVPIPKKTATA